MAKAGTMEYGIKFNVDTQSIQQLKAQLKEIQDMTTSSFIGSTNYQGTYKEAVHELMSLKKTANEVGVALDKSFNPAVGVTNLTKFSKGIKDIGIDKVAKDLNKLGPTGAAAFGTLNTALTTTNAYFKQTHTLLNSIATSFKNTVKWGLSSSVFNNLTGSIQKAWSFSQNLDKSLNDIRIVTGKSADEMERFAVQANKAAKELGGTTLDYTKGALIYYQQGLSDTEANQRTEITLKMANVLGSSAKEVSDYMTAIWNNFDSGSKSLEYFADVITALGAATASSAEEIAEGLEKFAAVSDTVGLSYEYATAALATVVAKTRQSADIVGTAFKTLFARIQDLELGKTLDDGTTLGKYAEALNKVGINIKNQQGELKSMNEILDEMGSKWQSLSKDQQVALAQNVAGTRQYTQLVALMDSWGDFQKNLTIAETATGSLQEKQDIYMQSTEAHLNQLSAATERLMNALIDKKGINSLIDGLTGVISLVANFTEGIGGGRNALLMLGSVGTQMLSGTLANSLNITLTNLERNKHAADDFKAALDNINRISVSSELDKQGVKNLSNYKDIFNTYQGDLNQVQVQQGNDYLETLESKLRANAKIEEEIKTAITEYVELIDLSEAEHEELLEDWNNLDNNFLKELKQTNEELNQEIIPKLAYQWNSTDTQSYEERIQEIKDAYKNLKNTLSNEPLLTLTNIYSTEDYQNIIETMQKINTQIETGLTKEARSNLSKLYNDMYNGAKIAGIKITNIYDTLNKESLKNKQIEIKNNEEVISTIESKAKVFFENMQRIGELKLFTNAIAGLGQMFSGINSLLNISKIWNNEGLSIWEKTVQIFSALGTSLPLFINGLSLLIKGAQTLKAIMPGILVGINSANIARFGSIAIIKKHTAELDKNTAAKIRNSMADSSNLKGINMTFISKKATETSGKFILQQDKISGAINKTSGSVFKLGTYVGALLKKVVPWLAIGAAVVGVIYAIVKAANRETEEIKSLEKASEQLKEQSEKLQTTVDNLNSSFDKYSSALETLQKCKDGTIEWNKACQNVNQTILEILQKYPQLAKIEGIITRDINTGLLSINEGIYKDYVQQLQNQSIVLNTAALSLQSKAEQKKFDLQTKTINNRINSNLRETHRKELGGTYTKDTPAVLTNAEILELSKFTITTEEYNQKIQEMADSFIKNGYITENAGQQWVKTMKNARIELQQWGKAWEDNEIQIKNTMKAISNSILGSEASNIEIRLFSDQYQENLEKYTKQWQQKIADYINVTIDPGDWQYDKFVSWLNEYAGEGTYVVDSSIDNAVRGWDGNNGIDVRNAKTGEIESYTRTQWGQILGSWQAAEEWFGSKNQDLVTKIPNKLREDTQNKLSYELINKLFDADFDVNQLSEKEYALVSKYKDLIVKDLEEVGGDAAKSLIENFELAMKSEWDAEKYAQFLKEQFENALTASATQDASLYGLEKDDLKEFGQYLADIADESEELADTLDENGTSAGFVARSIMRMNDAIEDLNKNQEEWLSILKESNKASEEYWKSLKDMRKAFSDLLNLEDEAEKFLSGEFFVKQSKDIQLAAEGDAEAIDRLRQAALDEIIIGIGIENKLDTKVFQSQIQQLQNDLNNLNIKLEAGVEIKEEDQQAFVEACNKMIEKAGLTTDQVNQLFSGMGYDVTFAEQPQKVTSIVKQYTTTHKIGNRGTETINGQTYETFDEITETRETGSKPIESEIPAFGMSTSEPGTTVIPKINKITKGASGSANNFSSKNKGGTGLSKSGSSSKPDKMDPVEATVDRYHKINTQITKVDNSLKKLQAEQEKFVGAKLIDNLNKQWELLNTQIDNYNEKLRIANGEQEELAEKLSGKGVLFNEDGTINNYVEAIRSQEAYVNSLVANYNSMSKAQQEKYKDTVEQAKKDFEQFQTDLDRYDELVSDFIPQLRQNIFDSLDKQIEINIKKFNMEIEISLNMDQATRDWNQWKKRVVDGIQEDDILGNAKARVLDYSTYYNNAATADVQEATRQVNDLLEEIRKMDNGEDNVYGNNRAQALEDLKTYYDQLRDSLSEVLDLQEEIHQAVLDEMDRVQEKFSEQVHTYELLSEIIQHDLKLTQMYLGEDAYGEMAKFYEKQQENYTKQLNFQRQQKDFWYAEMQAAEEGSKEWESAREKWESAVQEFNNILEQGLENAKNKFENAINDIFKKLNESITGGLGLDYVKTEWDLINENADRYLDTINKTYGIKELEKKYQKSINDSKQISIQQRLQKLMNEQITQLKEKDRLTQYDLDRANKLYEIELARIELENAAANRSEMRLRRDSQGNYTYQYVANQAAIDEAQNKLDELYNSLYNFDKERYNQVLNDAYDSWDNYQQAMAEAALINDPVLRAEKERMIQEQYNELMMQIANDYETSKYNLSQSFYWDLERLNDATYENLSEKEREIVRENLIPTWKNGLTEMIDAFAGDQGFAKVTTNAWNQIIEAQNQYKTDTEALEVAAGITFGVISEGLDDNLPKMEELLKDNDDLIDAYGRELEAVKAVWGEVKNLIEYYKEAEKAAKDAAAAAYAYQQQELERQRQEAAAQEQTRNTTNPDAVPTNEAKAFNDGKTTTNTSSNTNSSSNNTSNSGNKINSSSSSKTTSSTKTTTVAKTYYTITLHYGYGLSDSTKKVEAGQSVTIPGTATINGVSVKASWSIPSKGLCTGMGMSYTYVPNKSETVSVVSISVNGTTINTSSSSSSKFVKPTFATGGYTGEWNNGDNDGRLAWLHQKELVLNSKDTKNLLDSVEVIRNLNYSLGSNTLARLAGVSANIHGNDISSGNGLFEQDVHIDATFPNVHNAAEIETALNNLVNAASQRIMEKR